jgi:hypothetical protein
MSEVDERVVGTDEVVEAGLEELEGTGRVLGRFLGLHSESNLQGVGRKTACF